MIDEGPVLLDIADGIARLRLNRPDAANGMSVELLECAVRRHYGLPRPAGLRVLLLSGEGKNFCAGGDVHAFASKGEELPDYIRQATAYLQNAVTGMMRLEAPVITRCRALPRVAAALGSSAPPISSSPANRPSFLRAQPASPWRRMPASP